MHVSRSTRPSPGPRILSSVVLLTGLIGCASNAETSPTTEGSDSAGARIVENHGPRWKPGEGWTVSAGPRLTMGVLDGSEEYQFVNVLAASRQSDGDLVVLDGGAQSVRLYDAGGKFLRTLGGAGSGPGEFVNPGQVLVTEEDSVIVWDNALFRLTRFDPAGELAEVRTVDLAAIAKALDPPLYPGSIIPLADGRLLVRLLEKVLTKGSAASSSWKPRARSGALIVSGDLSTIDTLSFFGDGEETTVEAPWGPQAIRAPFGKRSWIAHQGSPAKVCVGDQEAPEIECFGPGDDRMLLRWSWAAPPAPTDTEMEAWRDATLRLFGQKIAEDDILRMLDEVQIPATRPPYSQILLDRVGFLWVELGPSGEPASSVDFLVFDQEGVLLGAVALPAIQVLEIGDDYLLGLHHDELEVEYLMVYALDKPRGGDH